jgi:hypothetical protein
MSDRPFPLDYTLSNGECLVEEHLLGEGACAA